MGRFAVECARAAQLSLSFPRRPLLSYRPRMHRRVSRRPRLRLAHGKTVPRRGHSRGVGAGQQVDRSSSPARGDGGGGSDGGRARAFAWPSWARLFLVFAKADAS